MLLLFFEEGLILIVHFVLFGFGIAIRNGCTKEEKWVVTGCLKS
jgi:hypothetical protein